MLKRWQKFLISNNFCIAAMRTIIAFSVVLHVVQSQIFENDLPVSLQPPPPQPQPKADFGTVFVPNIQGPVGPQIQQGPVGPPIQQGPVGPPIQQPVPAQPSVSQINPKQFAHRAVLITAEQESKLPPQLLNPFYKNPRIAEQLAKQSWFEPGENLVGDRETEKISRDKIYYALKSAGLIRRRRYAVR